MIQLTIIEGGEQKSFKIIAGKPMLIGRGASCDIQLTDPAVSRVHFQLDIRHGKVQLVDTNSSWGTLVNNEKVTECVLTSGDKVKIGETVLLLEDNDASIDQTLAPGAANKSPSAPEKKTDTKKAALNALSSVSAELIPSQWIEKQVMHYDIKSIVAESTSGVVYKGFDSKKNRDVAIKIFRPEFLAKEADQQRFLRAVKTMIPLRHENLVSTHAAGIKKKLCFTVSEFIDGESAAQMIERIGVSGMLDWKNVLKIGYQIARALEFAAEQKIVHRNITPQNILVRENDKVAKLGDLIFAKALEGVNMVQITQPGEIVGQLSFMAPEQLDDDQDVDTRSDIYSLGATLYALLTGHPPFEGKNSVQIIQRILSENVVSPKETHLSIPDMFEGVVKRMLEKSPLDRYQHPTSLITDLQRTAKFQGMTLE